MKTRVLVLMGGWSAERDVSLSTGAGAAAALREKGYEVATYDVSRDLPALLRALEPRPDVVFNVLHGRGGEDGVIQGVLDMLGITYTHSGLLASAVAMDKPMTKRLLQTVGVRSPRGATVTRAAAARGEAMPAPFVVKPVNEGSSVGVAVVREGDNRSSIEGDPDELVLVEEFVPGHDLFVSVMGDRALAVTEVQANSGFYDYEAKYTAGMARHLVPAPLPPDVYAEAMRFSLLAHQTLGCQGVSRSDLRWDDTKPGTEGLYFLEINTQPGMTPLSLVPEQAGHLGISYADLCAWIVEDALCRAKPAR
ncbi:D-alanine--D-alanine ligase [Arenibaculum pallidiluteum]|uniref:D-alanine--D-alanine ligase n=1 Tax=Arenibaculum pallidiluteum TaxID=2812559 RepID=UPI001A968B06|nr:D-alanine--D-alanine ligase [Arenibaculum pallidiluteum]